MGKEQLRSYGISPHTPIKGTHWSNHSSSSTLLRLTGGSGLWHILNKISFSSGKPPEGGGGKEQLMWVAGGVGREEWT